MRPAVITALWKWGDSREYAFEYTIEHAERWVAGVQRHMTVPHRTIVLVDDHWAGVARERLSQSAELFMIDPTLTVKGMSANMQAFHPDLGAEQGMFAGLDTIFVGDITDIVQWGGAPVGLPQEPNKPRTVCNAVTTFTRDGVDLIWSTYRDNPASERWHRYRSNPRFSDMRLVRHLWSQRKWPTLDHAFPGRVASYKVHVLPSGGDLTGRSIVYLHGNPRLGRLPDDDPVMMEWLRND